MYQYSVSRKVHTRVRVVAYHIRVAGATGTARFIDDSYAVEFCGYFPADHPKYSVIVTMNKKGLPASGGLMAGDVFRQIAEYMKEGTIFYIKLIIIWLSGVPRGTSGKCG